MRDLEEKPYSPDEQRVARFFAEECGVGGGDDPIGSLIASHAYLAQARAELRVAAREFLLEQTDENGRKLANVLGWVRVAG